MMYQINHTEDLNNSDSCEEKSHSLVSAVRDKYEQPPVDSVNSFCQIYVPKADPRINGGGDIFLPPRLAVDNCSISEAGPCDEIESLCRKVQELDVAKNRITDWKQVFTMVQHIPTLQFLNLSFNELDDSTFLNEWNQRFGHVKVLILNGTGVSWDIIGRLTTSFCSLTELHLSLNNYNSVDLPEVICYRSLTKLFLNSCKLHEWNDVAKLGKHFPCLESLNAIDSDIRTLAEEHIKDSFSALKSLNLSGNPLSSMEEIDKFKIFPSLQNLRITDVPVLDKYEERQKRQHLVSRLPNIVYLNGSKITDVEREDAERAFIRCFMNQDIKPSRFYELEAQHGKLDPLVDVDLSPKNIIQIMVKFEDKAEMMDIDVRQTVFDFKKLLRNFTGLPPSKFRVFHNVNFEGSFLDSNELRSANKTLLSIKLREEDELHIEKRDSV